MKWTLTTAVLLISILGEAVGEYKLTINIHSIENRGGRCADSDTSTCNSGHGCCTDNLCQNTFCNYYLRGCLRLKTTQVPLLRYPDPAACSYQGNTSILRFERFKTTQFSLIFSNKTWPAHGYQLYIELLHFQQNDTKDYLIDTFNISVNGRVSHTTPRIKHLGIYELASLEISTNLRCKEGTCGTRCELYNCTTCQPGYTGEFCALEIDECVNATCGDHSVCLDQINTYKCVCLPGYTSMNCDVDIDECLNPDACNYNGDCINTIGSYQCMCDPQHTGIYCETNLDRYEVTVEFLQFFHEGGRCADISSTCASGTGCCDSVVCASIECDYMFLFCERPVSAPISMLRSENRGLCVFTETRSVRTDTMDDFFGQIYGVPNPIKISRGSWPANGIQFYVELLDNDSERAEDENNELIDRFAINITGNVTSQKYAGVFNLTHLVLTVTIKCSENFYGENCQDFCIENCNESKINRRTLSYVVFSLVVVIVVAIIMCLCTGLVVTIHKYKRVTHRQQANQSKNLTNANSPNEEGYDLEVIRTNTYERISMSVGANRSRNNLPSNVLWPPPSNNQVLTTNLNLPSSMATNRSNPNSVCKSPFSLASTPGSPIITPSPYKKSYISTEGEFCDGGSVQESRDEYDYESPYWRPSDQKTELITQISKLRIKFVSNENIRELQILGSGEFGTVSKALWTQDYSNSSEVQEREVALKTLKFGASEEEKIKFLQEAVIMGQFCHPNIVRTLGLVTNHESHQYKIILEYMSHGSLNNYLTSLTGSCEKLSSQLLSYSRQVANGMSYLETKCCVHRDLAARNILVSEDEVCKIGDFGLSRELQNEAFYLARGGKIPIKWTAPEAIQYRLWSTSSDAWSYGCVLYEIWSLGCKPFRNIANREVLQKISKGYRLPPPPGCPKAIYDIMINCWNIDCDARPTFSKILVTLNQPEFKILKWSVEDQKKYSTKARTIGAPLSEGYVLHMERQQTYNNNS